MDWNKLILTPTFSSLQGEAPAEPRRSPEREWKPGLSRSFALPLGALPLGVLPLGVLSSRDSELLNRGKTAVLLDLGS